MEPVLIRTLCSSESDAIFTDWSKIEEPKKGSNVLKELVLTLFAFASSLEYGENHRLI